MPPHSKSRQCRTVQNDTLTQEVWDVMSSWKCSRPSHLSPCLPGHIQVFLLLLGALPFCLSPLQFPFTPISPGHIDLHTCVLFLLQQTDLCFVLLFVSVHWGHALGSVSRLVRDMWQIARSVELTGRLQRASGRSLGDTEQPVFLTLTLQRRMQADAETATYCMHLASACGISRNQANQEK